MSKQIILDEHFELIIFLEIGILEDEEIEISQDEEIPEEIEIFDLTDEKGEKDDQKKLKTE
jgi:hypothetical protein